MSAYDVIIVGAGPGGYVAAIRAAQLGLRVAIVERDHLGGICLNWGCIPTKSLLHSAEIHTSLRHAATFGVTAGQTDISLVDMVKRSRQTAGQLNAGVQFLLKKNKVDLIWGQAFVTAPGCLQISPSQTPAPSGALGAGAYEAANIIIATGARERPLPGLQPDGKRVWSYRHAMTAETLPASLAIIGAGAIGVEFASFYQSLGANVTLVERLDRILPQEDAEISDAMAKLLKKRGIGISTGCSVGNVEIGQSAVRLQLDEADGTSRIIECETVLCAAGVIANSEGLGLETVGVALKNGVITTDPAGRTSVAGIWAIGDVAGPPMLAHKAEHEGIRAVEAIAGLGSDHTKPIIPGAVFATPQVASVGLTEAAALAAGKEITIGRFTFRGNGKAVTLGETDGFVKTVFDAVTDRLLGAHMLGPNVSEMVALFSFALSVGATRDQLAHTVFPHPTLSEAMHEAVLAAGGQAIHA
ncbi:dihydrolipoyl dehydrogenase [Rhizobium alvei]|uniref:Dihydrolipoyl dehydrogenase n=1 Tax=Rhizobium alvei TaxID=1132659 RepID=A0ABT8YTJ4_9HYPH|nr:dihydrolipoyl dehydrogenase [Rhizobium alvei]MDO6966921.1 dihydrolipoyl dehydrogenase [Rhizobium alvei]